MNGFVVKVKPSHIYLFTNTTKYENSWWLEQKCILIPYLHKVRKEASQFSFFFVPITFFWNLCSIFYVCNIFITVPLMFLCDYNSCRVLTQTFRFGYQVKVKVRENWNIAIRLKMSDFVFFFFFWKSRRQTNSSSEQCLSYPI